MNVGGQVSNTRRARELNGGKLTRPKSQWKGRKRGHKTSPYGAEMNREFASMFRSMISRNVIPKVTLPARKGADRG